MNEIACQFGEQGRLNGIVTQSSKSNEVPIVLILISAGLTAKTGPFRLHTQLAREASKQGLTTMRFDLGGIGNSEEIYLSYPLKLRTELDIKQAIDYMETTYKASRFILGGLCSGAEDSLNYAYTDSRVAGVFLIDGHAYRTNRWWLRNIFSTRLALLMAKMILKSLTLRNKQSNSIKEPGLEGDSSGLIDYQQMSLEESSEILRVLTVRNTKLLYIYTLGLSDRINHRNQFYQMFPDIDFKDLVTLCYLPHMGHIQIFEQDRIEMVKIICEWLGENFSTYRLEGTISAK